MKQQTINLPSATSRPYSMAVRAGDLIFVSGMVGDSDLVTGQKATGIKDQTRQCLENMKHVLEAAGASMSDVVKCTVFISSQADFQPMNEVYRTYFPKDMPARSTVVAGLVRPEMVVEVEGVAYRPQ